MGRALRKNMTSERRVELEDKWLARIENWKMDSPRAVTDAMARTLRAWANGVITAETYRMLFAGLKEVRQGREQEIIFARGGDDAGQDGRFAGLIVKFSTEKEPPKMNGVDEEKTDGGSS